MSNSYGPRIVLLERDASAIQSLLCNHPLVHERAAWVLFRKTGDAEVGGLPSSARYLCVEVIPIHEQLILRSSASMIKVKTTQLVPLMKRARDENLVIGFVHSHPRGALWFSCTDDDNELDILTSIFNRNGSAAELVALILTQDGHWRGRVRTWESVDSPVAVRHIAMLGKRIEVHIADDQLGDDAEQFDRQSIAFGPEFTAKLRTLRAAVVGAGGTGSAVSNLLCRLGVGELMIIDADSLEVSNLNRVHGANRRDADEKRNKADVQRDSQNALGLGTRVVSVVSWVDALEGATALQTADVVFGCTDDHLGRQSLNRAVYYWLQPLFDMGLDASLEDVNSKRTLRNLDARVSVVMPTEGPCLRCQKVINDDAAASEELRRRNPDEHAKLEREEYIRGSGQRSPGVVPYTTFVACLATDEFIERLQPYKRRESYLSNFWWQFVTETQRRLARTIDKDCPFCGSRRFLAADDRRGLIGRPSLKPPH
jgi:molybdopterin/thiamine biosynthesis adenylyltransferase/proteasome lid subunit RPN8/RPN11